MPDQKRIATGKRMSLTVETEDGVMRDADNLTVTFRDGDRHPMLSFVCSGVQLCFPHESIKSIRFGYTDWCPKCDQQIPWITDAK